MDGNGGAPGGGGGGGGGGAAGAPETPGIGGAGGAGGGGGRGGGADGAAPLGEPTVSSLLLLLLLLLLLFPVVAAVKGFGGPIVPKSIEARCLASPPLPLDLFSSSSSSDVELASESTTDQSSSLSAEERSLDARGIVAVVSVDGSEALSPFGLDSLCCVKRKNGFVETSVTLAEGTV